MKRLSSRLRHRLVLQKEVRTADTAGGYSRSWQTICELWAEILPVSGGERVFGGQVQAEITHRVRLRYRKDINSGMRLVFEQRAFNIRSLINAAEEKEMLDLLVQEGVAT